MHRFHFVVQRQSWLLAGLAVALQLLQGAGGASAQGPQPRAPQTVLGTGFTYQGQLKRNGSGVSDNTCSMTFSLWDSQSNGTQIGSSQTLNNVAVANGLFTVVLNGGGQFGASAFDGSTRWLENDVMCAGDGSPVPLSRQQLRAAPYAHFSAAPWVTSGSDIHYNAGNVGIGVTSPGDKLDVAGNILVYPASGPGFVGVQNRSSADYSQMVFFDDAGTYRGYLGYIGAAAGLGPRNDSVELGSNGFGKDITFRPNGTEIMRLTSSGYIGIGTPTTGAGLNPGAPLEVFAPDAMVRMRNSNDAGGAFAGNTFNALELGLYNPSGSAWGVIPANTTRSFLGFDNTGKVGSLTNTYPGVTFRNVLDDGSGNATIAGVATAGAVTVQGGLLVEFVSKLYGGVELKNLETGGQTSLCLLDNISLATCSSSRRYKNNIADLPLGLATVMQLRPVTYDWKSNGAQDLGLVAEEVNAVAPILTTLNQDGQVEGVKYDRLTAVLVKGIQEQQQQIADLKAANTAQQDEIAQLKQDSTDIKGRVAALEQASPGAQPQAHAGNAAFAFLVGAAAVVVVERARKLVETRRRNPEC